jgi:hypothetical protein
MAKNHYAQIVIATGIVENIIVADDDFVLDGYYFRKLEERPDVGWIFDPKSDTFSPPPEIAPDVVADLQTADVDDIAAALAKSGLSAERIEELRAKLGA